MKVSVFMLTYNHERYIAQAINGVLMQNVNFDYELVIGEDCSTDGTRGIVLDFQKRYPDKIRVLLSETNLGAHGNAVRTLQACKGEYIAQLDGDDCWTSPYKLQKQVDFLDNHPECAMCCHTVRVSFEDSSGESHTWPPPNQKEISTLEDLLLRNFVPNCAVVYRRGLLGEFPDWAYELKMPDWFFHVVNARHGSIGYINEVMGVYRVHRGGTWSGLSVSQLMLAEIEFYEKVNSYLNFKYVRIIKPRLLECWTNLAAIFVGQGIKQALAQSSPRDVIRIFDDWPTDLPLPYAWKVQVLGKIYPALLFESAKAHDIPKMRYYWLKTMRYDPSWLRNRGVWSIGSEAFLGRWVADRLRRAVRKACPSWVGNARLQRHDV